MHFSCLYLAFFPPAIKHLRARERVEAGLVQIRTLNLSHAPSTDTRVPLLPTSSLLLRPLQPLACQPPFCLSNTPSHPDVSHLGCFEVTLGGGVTARRWCHGWFVREVVHVNVLSSRHHKARDIYDNWPARLFFDYIDWPNDKCTLRSKNTWTVRPTNSNDSR